MFQIIPNTVQQALARLLTQYTNSPNLQSFMTAMLGPIQNIEAVLTQLNTLRYLSGAFGQQLDNLGQIVGVVRPPGESDAQYAQLIQGQIAQSRSDGQPEAVINVFSLFTGCSLTILDEYYCGVLLEGDWIGSTQDLANSLIGILNDTVPAGTACGGIIVFDPSIPFAYDGVLPGLGYDDGSGLIGGTYPIHYLLT